ncbi:ATP-binding protein [Spirillospora sp. CA-108201]
MNGKVPGSAQGRVAGVDMIAFRPDLEMIRTARDHVAKIAADWPVNEHVVRVVVSELVTNAVLHAGTDEIRVDAYADGDVYVVAVWDADATAPTLRSPEDESLDGRGLLIVGEMVSRWGTRHDGQEGGKTVFAEWAAR